MLSRVFLLGFMGCGKSTIGRLLAGSMAYDFKDLDHEIELVRKASISDIFMQSGEQEFRLLEQQTLHSMVGYDRAIVACGGGTPCFFDNMHWMNSNGITVFLNTSPDDLMLRLQSEQAHRPLIRDFDSSGLKQFIHRKLEERLPFYTQAQLQVMDSGDKVKSAQWIQQYVLSLQVGRNGL